MSGSIPDDMLQLRSLAKRSGELEISLARIPVPKPGPNEVLIRVEATPINPSDLGLLFAGADPATATLSGSGEASVLTAKIPENAMRSLAARLNTPMPVGNEGAGTVVATGDAPAAKALLGKVVAASSGAMYAQYRALPADQCLPLPAGTTAAEGASAFVNPLTALAMVETMRIEGHTALVHTAAASNLGQMLVRLCRTDGVGLVNVVRKPEQVELLRAAGAEHVVNQNAPTFSNDLVEALAATGATLAFDATGGGRLGSQILTAMEVVATRSMTEYSRYGSSVHKQLYIYGVLEPGPTELGRSFGFSWGVGGWLVFNYLRRVGVERTQALRARVAAELKTTFASHYAQTISLVEVLQPASIAVYAQRATGAKVLIAPNR